MIYYYEAMSIKTKYIFQVYFFISLLVFISSCSKGDQIATFSIEPENEEIIYSDFDFSSIENLMGRDNTIDEYSALTNVSYEIYTHDKEIGGSYAWIMDDTSTVLMKKHIFSDYKQCFDEVETINISGDSILRRYDNENQIWGIGSCATKGLKAEMYLSQDYTPSVFVVLVKDDTYTEKYRIPLTFLREDFAELTIPSGMVFDKDNQLHFYIKPADDSFYYYIVSTEGNIINRQKMPDNMNIYGIFLSNDQRAILLTDIMEKDKQYEKREYNYLRFNGIDFETIFSFSCPATSDPYAIYVRENGSVLMADTFGIYSCDNKLDEKQELYSWINHGIRVKHVLEIRSQGEGIGVLFEQEKSYCYIYVEPVKEKLEMLTISIAVSPATRDIYKEAVTEFNRKYPTITIEVEEYTSEDMLLLTQINAQKGPVLIDTTLTGFDDQKILFEPLDKALESMGILNDLNKTALEWGMIDGHIYGITTDFYINTTVIGKSEYSDMDYDIFTNLIEQDYCKYITDSEEPSYDAYKVFSKFYIHGFDDNYFIDRLTGSTVFSSNEFKKLIRTVKEKVSDDEYIEPGMSIYDGSVLLNQITISRPRDLSAYMTIYGEDVIFAGYPHSDGSYSLISSHMPLAIRKNASKEEKEIACVFMKLLLSYESQIEMAKASNFGFSVREDVINEQMESVDFSVPVSLGRSYEPVKIGSNITTDKTKAKLYELLSDSKAEKSFPNDLNVILFEEMTDYFNNTIDEDILCDHLENRVNIYLMEQ